jgi:hypothetical protein
MQHGDRSFIHYKCYVCEEYFNPYFKCYSVGDQNFKTIYWFGTDNADIAHEECWWMENN